MKETIRNVIIILILIVIVIFAIPVNNISTIPDEEYVTWQDLESGKADKKGYGLTVFKGTKISRFDVEYEGVMPHPLFPKEKVVLVRMGKPLIGSNVLSGMSGSPVYFKKGDKWCLVGAIAFGWNLPTAGKSLGGITPIGAMLLQGKIIGLAGSIFNQKQQLKLKLLEYQKKNQNRHSDPEFAKLEKEFLETLSRPIELGKYGGGSLQLLQPLFTVVKNSLDETHYKKSRVITPKPGEAVMMMFVEGDVSLGATCTITHVSKNKYLACGHPVLGDGKITIPAYKASIATSYKGPMESFKMVADQHESLGYISFDSIFAIEGRLESPPKDAMIPVKLVISFNKKNPIEINYGVFRDKLYSSALIDNAAKMIVANFWNPKQKATIKATSTVRFDDKVVKLNRAYASGSVISLGPFLYIVEPWQVISQTAGFVDALLASRWNFKINEVKVTIDIEPGEKVFQLDAYKLADKSGNPIEEVKLGSKFDLILGLRNNEGTDKFFIRIPLEIPEKMNIKKDKDKDKVSVTVHIESGDNYREKDLSKLLDHQPESGDEFLRALLVNERDPQKIYVQVVFPKTEVDIGNVSAMPINMENRWVKVSKLDFLRSLKTFERKVVVKEIDSPRRDFVFDIDEEIRLELDLK